MNNSKEKILSLFNYLKGLCELKTKSILHINNQEMSIYYDDIPKASEYVKTYYRDTVQNDEVDNCTDLITVSKPEFEKCPQPPQSIIDWLEPNWDSIKEPEVTAKETITKENIIEEFTESKQRVELFNQWNEDRNIWYERQLKIKNTREFFKKLYNLYIDLQRDSDSLELVVGNGFIKYKNNKEVYHPILLKRVSIEFDSTENIVKICDTDTDPELYTTILNSKIENLNLSSMQNLKTELKEKFYHPLDRNDAYDYLEKMAHELSSNSKFVKDENTAISPDDELFVEIKPVLFVRKRIDGTAQTIEAIVEDINNGGEIPLHLQQLVSGGKIEISENIKDIPIEELLAQTSGESLDILMAKEANREQLEIAKRIEQYSAVSVQGPPGTGKTHTIANLLGHFLSQGKRVLITSHTNKALKVLKEKLPKNLQSLCVSVLDDKNTDMEKSIDGITEYMSIHTSYEMESLIAQKKEERKIIISKLADIRKKIYAIKNKEVASIIICGEEISPMVAAKFVADNTESLGYIPGKIQSDCPLPLTIEELTKLYQTNAILSEKEIIELDSCLPNPQDIIAPSNFEKYQNLKEQNLSKIKQIESELDIKTVVEGKDILIKKDDMEIVLAKDLKNYDFTILKKMITPFKNDIEKWKIEAAVDNRMGPEHKGKWLDLIAVINKTKAFADSITREFIGKTITIAPSVDISDAVTILNGIITEYNQKGKISFTTNCFNNKWKELKKLIKINNHILENLDDCKLAYKYLTLLNYYNSLNLYWVSLIKQPLPKFKGLTPDAPWYVASNYIPEIERYINWDEKTFKPLTIELSKIGLEYTKLIKYNLSDSNIAKLEKDVSFVKFQLPKYIELIDQYIKFYIIKGNFIKVERFLLNGNRRTSSICNKLVESIRKNNIDGYSTNYNELVELYSKYEIRNTREELLAKLQKYAPTWADSIRNRIDEIGKSTTVPSTVSEAWKWKQLEQCLFELLNEPFEELQKQNLELSKKLRLTTAELCEYNSWFHLLRKTENDLSLRQSLINWKLLIRKIGKGTGKFAAQYRIQAKMEMIKCQEAVPAWIMPINKAFETLVPGKNLFDIVIIDEASQSDITALTLTYMAKKVVVVGDDKQVSPMAVGVDLTKINGLMEEHLKHTFTSTALFEPKTSLYDIASTTFQPLMLREHFRCVPEIIGFSNSLCYDGKIKPLRDESSSNLLPAVINYRVDGHRNEFGQKINNEEAETIVSLIMACLETPEYQDSTFGVISLLGKEQAIKVQTLINERIEPNKIEKHQILCGDASSFQGDERDVIFLTMVDSNESDGPLRLVAGGTGDAREQRYNVAASRAKNQMWLIHSLNEDKDLQEGDLRKRLLKYTKNPKNYLNKLKNIGKNADSPFEEDVCKALVSRGYNIIQQYPVGAYRIDMVATYKGQKIAIECDGERYHSGAEKIREDMERQTILERIGWTFIRIRGSEYYINKDKIILNVISKLNEYGIFSENISASIIENDSALKNNIILKAKQIRSDWI